VRENITLNKEEGEGPRPARRGPTVLKKRSTEGERKNGKFGRGAELVARSLPLGKAERKNLTKALRRQPGNSEKKERGRSVLTAYD